MADNLYENLKDPKVLGILSGESMFGQAHFGDDNKTYRIALPEATGDGFFDLCKKFGLDVPNGPDKFKETREYWVKLVQHCIDTDTCPDLLGYLFSKQYVSKSLGVHDAKSMESAYNDVCSRIIAKINGALWVHDCELVCEDNKYHIKAI